MKATINHVDTCLSCYANRVHDVAFPVDGSTTLGEAIDQLVDEVRTHGFQSREDQFITAAHYDAFGMAILALKEEHAAHLEKPFAPDLEVRTEDDDGCAPCMAFFDVSFSEVD